MAENDQDHEWRYYTRRRNYYLQHGISPPGLGGIPPYRTAAADYSSAFQHPIPHYMRHETSVAPYSNTDGFHRNIHSESTGLIPPSFRERSISPPSLVNSPHIQNNPVPNYPFGVGELSTRATGSAHRAYSPPPGLPYSTEPYSSYQTRYPSRNITSSYAGSPHISESPYHRQYSAPAVPFPLHDHHLHGRPHFNPADFQTNRILNYNQQQREHDIPATSGRFSNTETVPPFSTRYPNTGPFYSHELGQRYSAFESVPNLRRSHSFPPQNSDPTQSERNSDNSPYEEQKIQPSPNMDLSQSRPPSNNNTNEHENRSSFDHNIGSSWKSISGGQGIDIHGKVPATSEAPCSSQTPSPNNNDNVNNPSQSTNSGMNNENIKSSPRELAKGHIDDSQTKQINIGILDRAMDEIKTQSNESGNGERKFDGETPGRIAEKHSPLRENSEDADELSKR